MVKTDTTILCHKSALDQRVKLKTTHTLAHTCYHCLLKAISNAAMHTITQTLIETCPLHHPHKYNKVYNIGTSRAHAYRLRQLQYISPVRDGTTVTGVSHKRTW